jgi:hypothetical protein
MVGNVFEKAPVGLALADNAGNVWPQVAGVLVGSLAPCDAERLARISGSNAIDFATPWLAIEGSNIRPDRRLIQPSCFHMRDKEAGDIGFPLDSTNQLCCWFGKLETKLKPAPVGVAD